MLWIWFQYNADRFAQMALNLARLYHPVISRYFKRPSLHRVSSETIRRALSSRRCASQVRAVTSNTHFSKHSEASVASRKPQWTHQHQRTPVNQRVRRQTRAGYPLSLVQTSFLAGEHSYQWICEHKRPSFYTLPWGRIPGHTRMQERRMWSNCTKSAVILYTIIKISHCAGTVLSESKFLNMSTSSLVWSLM
jgi:hypothetical protein